MKLMSNATVFFCKECGYESSKWLGKCPGCNSWNSFVEEKVAKAKSTQSKTRQLYEDNKSVVKSLKDIVVGQTIRIDTGFDELNRVFRRWNSRRLYKFNWWRAWYR